MTEWLTGLFEGLSGNPVSVFFITVLIGMIPVVELRGAIPVGVALGLDPLTAMIAGIIGNLIPVPFIILFGLKIFDFLSRKSKLCARFFGWIKRRTEAKSETVKKFRFVGLWIFVAIPLPGTGGVTGSLVAAMLGMKLRDAIPPIFLGIITAGLVVTGITYGVSTIAGLNESIMWFTLGIILVLIVLVLFMAFGPLKKKVMLRITFMSLYSLAFAVLPLLAFMFGYVFFDGAKREALYALGQKNIVIAVWLSLVFGVLYHLLLILMKKRCSKAEKKGKAIMIPLFVLAATAVFCIFLAAVYLLSIVDGGLALTAVADIVKST